MNFLLFLFNGAFNCVMLMMAINATVPNYDSNYWFGLLLSFIGGFGLGIVRDIRKDNFSLKNSSLKFFASLFLCYFGYLAKEDWGFPSISLEWFIAGLAFGSLYVVDALEKVFSLGIPKVAQLLLNNLSSYVSTYLDKNKNQKEDNL